MTKHKSIIRLYTMDASSNAQLVHDYSSWNTSFTRAIVHLILFLNVPVSLLLSGILWSGMNYAERFAMSTLVVFSIIGTELTRKQNKTKVKTEAIVVAQPLKEEHHTTDNNNVVQIVASTNYSIV